MQDTYEVTLTNPADPEYTCTMTVYGASPEDAKAFAEQQNPGLISTLGVLNSAPST